MRNCNIYNTLFGRMSLRVNKLFIKRSEILSESHEIKIESQFICLYHKLWILLNDFAYEIRYLIASKHIFSLIVFKQPYY